MSGVRRAGARDWITPYSSENSWNPQSDECLLQAEGRGDGWKSLEVSSWGMLFLERPKHDGKGRSFPAPLLQRNWKVSELPMASDVVNDAFVTQPPYTQREQSRESLNSWACGRARRMADPERARMLWLLLHPTSHISSLPCGCLILCSIVADILVRYWWTHSPGVCESL